MKTKARKTQPLIETLEARIAPATLDLTGGVLTFTATSGIANDVTLTMTVIPSGTFAGQFGFVISSVGDAMTLSGGAGGVLTGGGGVAIAVAPAVSSIVIDLGEKDDVMLIQNAIGSGFAPLNIVGGADGDTVTFAGPVAVQGALTANAEVTNVNGSVISSGNATFVTNTMVLNTSTGQILGNTDITIRPINTSRDVTLGTEVAGTLSLTAAELVRISANGTLTLGERTNPGSALNITAAVNLPTVGSLKLEAGTGGVSQGGSLTVSDLVVDAAGVVSLADAGNDVDKLAATASGAFTFSNGSNALTVDGVSAAGDIDLSAGSMSVTGLIEHTNKGAVTLTANTMSIGADISTDTGVVTLAPKNTFGTINLGTATGGLDLTNAELDRIDASTLRIGSFNTIAINVSSAVTIASANVQTLALIAGAGSISDSSGAGSVVVNELRTRSGDATTLNGANNVVRLAAEVTGTDITDDFVFRDAGGFQVATVDNVTGITTSTGTSGVRITLSASGTVTQTAVAALVGHDLRIVGDGPFTLDSPNNQMFSINGTVAGAITYVDSDSLIVANVVGPLLTTDSPITLAAPNGNLTVQNPAGGSDLSAGASTVSLSAGGTITIETDAGIVGTGGVTLTGNGMNILGTVAAGTNIALLKPATAGTSISLGGAGGTLQLDSTELNRLIAGEIQIGESDNSAGAITIAGAIAPTDSAKLTIFSGGTIKGSGNISETTLVLSSLAGIALSGNNVDTLTLNGFGDVAFSNGASALTVGGIFNTNSIPPTTDPRTITVTAGNLTIPAGRSITNDSGGAIVLNSNFMDIQGTIETAGRVTLQPTASGRDINLGGATGGLDLTAAELDNITAGTLQIGSDSVSFTGNIDVSSVITIAEAKVPTVALLTGGGSIATSGSGELRLNALRTLSAGATTLSAINAVSRLAAEVTGTSSGDGFTFADINGFTIDTVDGVAGIHTGVDGTGLITTSLTANAGVIQIEGATLTGVNLVLGGTGSFTLDDPGNDMARVAGTVSGAISYTDSDGISLGVAIPSTALTTGNSPITITTVNGDITVLNTAAALDVSAGTSTVSLRAGGTGNVLTINSGAALSGDSGVTLIADDMAINGTVDSAATVHLTPATAGREIQLGSFEPSTLVLDGLEIDRITASRLVVGEPTSGDITINRISPAGTNFLSLITGGEIAPEFPPVSLHIEVENLTLEANTGIGGGSGMNISVTRIEAKTISGFIHFRGGPLPLTIGGLSSGIDGLFAGSGIIAIASGSINLAEGVNATGDVTLRANGASSDILSSVDSQSAVDATGDITVTAGRDILLGQGNSDAFLDLIALNNITLTAGRDVTVARDSRVLADDDENGSGDLVVTTGPGGLLTVSDTAALSSGSGNNTTVNADRLAVSANIVPRNGTLTIQPVTAGRAVNLGSVVDTTAGTLEISNAEIALIFATNIVIGSADTGDVTFSAAIDAGTTPSFEVRSGGTITNSFTGTAFTGPLLRIGSGTLVPGGNGLFSVAGNFTFGPDATFAPTIGGTTPGTDLDQLAVTGTIDLGGAAFAPVVAFSPAPGTLFPLIVNDAAEAITGTFAGLAQGQVLETPAGDFLAASYAGGTGNDFEVKALVAVAPTISANGKTATYFDEDGDKVTVKTSKGTFTAANFLFRPTSDTGLQQLRLLDLTTGADFTGAKITLAAKKTAGLGDKLANVGAINATGKTLGAVSIAGDLGQFAAAAAKSLTVQSLGALGLATQGPGGSSQSDIAGTLGKLTVKGDFASAMNAGTIGPVSIGGTYEGGPFRSLIGGIGNLSVKGDFLGGVSSAGSVGKVTVGGDFDDGGLSAATSIGGLKVAGVTEQAGVTAGTSIGAIVSTGTISDMRFTAGTSIAKVTAKAGMDDSRIVAGGSIGDVKVTGDLTDTTVFAGSTLGALNVSGNLSECTLTAFGKALAPTKGVDLAIKSLTVGGNVELSRVLAGYDTAGVAKNADASIGAILVKGTWALSSVLAGVEVGTDGFAGTADDRSIVGGTRNNPNLVSQIASITIKGQASGSAAAGDNFGIVAEQIVKATIGTTKLALTKGARSATDIFPVGTTGPGVGGDATDFVIREVVL